MFTRNKDPKEKRKMPFSAWEIALYPMLGTLMFCSKLLMELLPNVHLLGMFTMVCAIVFRSRGLIPIYIYVLINGLYAGFAPWWVPYLYVWTVLWGITMLLPKNMKKRTAAIVYPLVCCFHGLIFGLIYSPVHALMMGLNFEQAIAWTLTGTPWDVLHGVGNLFAGILVLPISELLLKLLRGRIKKAQVK